MISEKLYRLLLLAYPTEHRREYGEAMVQLFRDRMRHDGGGIRTAAIWVETVIDLAHSSHGERKEEAMLSRDIGTEVLAGPILFFFSSSFLAIGLFAAPVLVGLAVEIGSLFLGYSFAVESLGPLGYIFDVNNFVSSLMGFFVLAVLVRLVSTVRSAAHALRL